MKGVLAEAATTGIVRYNWLLLKPLVVRVLDSVLQDFDAESKVEIGPSLPLANDCSLQDLQKRLHGYIDCFTDVPFTFQRLCELLIEPHKQYTHLHKVAVAYEKLLLVVQTQPVTLNPPPRPRISDIGPVNENITVVYSARSSDAHQRVPLEPLFQVDKQPQPEAQPMSIDSQPLHQQSPASQPQGPVANGFSHAAEQLQAAASGHPPLGQHGPALDAAASIPCNSEASAQADSVLGQSKAGLMNKVHALADANVPVNSTDVMQVDAS